MNVNKIIGHFFLQTQRNKKNFNDFLIKPYVRVLDALILIRKLPQRSKPKRYQTLKQLRKCKEIGGKDVVMREKKSIEASDPYL